MSKQNNLRVMSQGRNYKKLLNKFIFVAPGPKKCFFVIKYVIFLIFLTYFDSIWLPYCLHLDSQISLFSMLVSNQLFLSIIVFSPNSRQASQDTAQGRGEQEALRKLSNEVLMRVGVTKYCKLQYKMLAGSSAGTREESWPVVIQHR